MYRHPEFQDITCEESGLIKVKGVKFSFQDDSYTYYDQDSGGSVNIGEFRKAAKEYHDKINEIIQEPSHGIIDIPNLNANDKLMQALSFNKPTPHVLETKHEIHNIKHETEETKHENIQIKHEGNKNSKFIGTYFHLTRPFTSSRSLAQYLEISNATAIKWAKTNKNGCSFEPKQPIENQSSDTQ